MKGSRQCVERWVLVVVALVSGISACADNGSNEATVGATAPESSAPIVSTAAEAPQEPTDKAGNTQSEEPITLSLATFSVPERPGGAVAARFAEEVMAQGGSLSIDVQYAGADPYGDFSSGKADMLLAPTRSLDTLGVTSFNALSMPLLVDDDTQADRVAADPVVGTMMAGLDAINATGLLLTPTTAQHIALQGEEPLRSLGQLAGGVRAHPHSNFIDELYAAMGSEAKLGLNDDAWHAAVQGGEVVGKEFPTALALVGPAPVVMASNLTLYYEFQVVIIRNDALAELSDDQAAALRAAAASAAQRSIDERVHEDEAFQNECAKGAEFSAAPLTLWAEIGRAVDDLVLEQLEDPVTRETYDSIKRAAGQRITSWPNECRNGVVVPYEPPTAAAGSEPDEGVYRVDGRTTEQLLVSGVGADTAGGNVVDYWQLTLDDGRATLALHRPDGQVVEEGSDYEVDADGHLVFTADPGSDGLNGPSAWMPTETGFRTEPLPTDGAQTLNILYDVAGLGLFEFTKVG